MTSTNTPTTTTTAPPAPPSVHVRAAVTWIAIFPMVALGLTVLAPLATDWHPVLRAFVLTIVIVPLAVYVVVPRLLKLYATRIAPRRRSADGA